VCHILVFFVAVLVFAGLCLRTPENDNRVQWLCIGGIIGSACGIGTSVLGIFIQTKNLKTQAPIRAFIIGAMIAVLLVASSIGARILSIAEDLKGFLFVAGPGALACSFWIAAVYAVVKIVTKEQESLMGEPEHREPFIRKKAFRALITPELILTVLCLLSFGAMLGLGAAGTRDYYSKGSESFIVKVVSMLPPSLGIVWTLFLLVVQGASRHARVIIMTMILQCCIGVSLGLWLDYEGFSDLPLLLKAEFAAKIVMSTLWTILALYKVPYNFNQPPVSVIQ